MPDICPSPNSAVNIHVKVLHEACLWFSGEHRLASYLGVNVEQVNAWLAGAVPVPDDIFLACLDVVPDQSMPPAALG